LSVAKSWEVLKPALETSLKRAQTRWQRLALMLVGAFCLAVEEFDLFVEPREQGWISFVGFALIIVGGWFLLRNHHLAVVVVSLFLVPIGTIWFIPIVSQLGIIILMVLGVRWIILKIRHLRS
jgi:membrane-bound ClpP family serine protease